MGISTIGQLAQADPERIKGRLGKHGLLVWRYANGVDDDPVNETGYQFPIKSVGNSITTARDLVTEEDIRTTVMLLAESVVERMREKFFRCNLVQVYIRYSNLASYQRQEKLPFPSCTAQRIGDTATKLILSNWTRFPLRSPELGGVDTRAEDSAHTVAFYKGAG